MIIRKRNGIEEYKQYFIKRIEIYVIYRYFWYLSFLIKITNICVKLWNLKLPYSHNNRVILNIIYEKYFIIHLYLVNDNKENKLNNNIISRYFATYLSVITYSYDFFSDIKQINNILCSIYF